jgi:hypothetical protein
LEEGGWPGGHPAGDVVAVLEWGRGAEFEAGLAMNRDEMHQVKLLRTFSRMNELLTDGRYWEADTMLREADVANDHLDVLLTLLTSSAYADEVLQDRQDFYRRVRQRFTDELGEAEAAEVLDTLG